MRQNFFEVIGMVDVERVHSQMLAWIFTARTLSLVQKLEILTALTGHVHKDSEIKVSTEHDHIDVLIEMDSAVIVIENKIKITAHDNQLDRYEKAVGAHAQPQYYVYLSLLPEVVNAPNWKMRTYAELHSVLSSYRFVSPTGCDQYIFNEYIDAIAHLTKVVTDFDRDHTKFLNVFTDGSLTKREKHAFLSIYTDERNYVRKNQLETPLQRQFLGKIRDRIIPPSKLSRIEETRGVALFHVVIDSRVIRGVVFEWAIQFQGQTAKLNCSARDYAKSASDQLPSEVMKDFEEAKRLHRSLRLNLPRTKAYISLSKNMDFEWSDTLEEIAAAHAAAYKELSAIGHSLVRSYDQSAGP